jgi:hypothetical protein
MRCRIGPEKMHLSDGVRNEPLGDGTVRSASAVDGARNGEYLWIWIEVHSELATAGSKCRGE